MKTKKKHPPQNTTKKKKKTHTTNQTPPPPKQKHQNPNPKKKNTNKQKKKKKNKKKKKKKKKKKRAEKRKGEKILMWSSSLNHSWKLVSGNRQQSKAKEYWRSGKMNTGKKKGLYNLERKSVLTSCGSIWGKNQDLKCWELKGQGSQVRILAEGKIRKARGRGNLLA